MSDIGSPKTTWDGTTSCTSLPVDGGRMNDVRWERCIRQPVTGAICLVLVTSFPSA